MKPYRALWALTILACMSTGSRAFRIAADAPSPSDPLNMAYLSPAANPLECPAKTVNYITHSLPQQCRKTGWVGPTGGSAASATGPGASSVILTEPANTMAVNSKKLAPELSSPSSVTAAPTTVVGEPGQAETTADLSSAASTTATAATPSPSSSAASATMAVAAREPKVDADSELESALDGSNFLSFEEWKRRNLAKSGQSLDGLQQRQLQQQRGPNARPQPRGINNALDSLGDDTEIDLDFGRFTGGASSAAAAPQGGRPSGKDQRGGDASAAAAAAGGQQDAPSRERRGGRSKDAGTTCKERFNYASFDCAATVLKTNAESKGSSAILVENKDSYMLNECAAANKFFIVELCDDILIDTVVLANFEFFSSIFRTFRVSVSDRYPMKPDKWRSLGVFEARNSRDIQAFRVENPLIWARYLRVEFLTHYGSEFYCPVSLLRVHGTTMMEEFKNQEEAAKGDDDFEDEDASEADAKAAALSDGTRNVDTGRATDHNSRDPPIDANRSSQIGSPVSASGSIEHALPGNGQSPTEQSKALQTVADALLFPDDNRHLACRISPGPTASSPLPGKASALSQPHPAAVTAYPKGSTVASQSIGQPPTAGAHGIAASGTGAPAQQAAGNPTASHAPNLPATRMVSPQPPEHDKPIVSPSQPPSVNPTTQENFFKSVHKRLQLLETDATLSLQYIEEQSRILRDAFTKVEKRQLAKTTAFLHDLNTTVFAELRGFRQQYDQIWQSTVLELESQREQSQKEMLVVSARLVLLADEVVLQRRMSVVQSVLLLLCLAFVIFSRLAPVVSSGGGSSSSGDAYDRGGDYMELHRLRQQHQDIDADADADADTDATTVKSPSSPSLPPSLSPSPSPPSSRGRQYQHHNHNYNNHNYDYQVKFGPPLDDPLETRPNSSSSSSAPPPPPTSSSSLSLSSSPSSSARRAAQEADTYEDGEHHDAAASDAADAADYVDDDEGRQYASFTGSNGLASGAQHDALAWDSVVQRHQRQQNQRTQHQHQPQPQPQHQQRRQRRQSSLLSSSASTYVEAAPSSSPSSTRRGSRAARKASLKNGHVRRVSGTGAPPSPLPSPPSPSPSLFSLSSSLASPAPPTSPPSASASAAIPRVCVELCSSPLPSPLPSPMPAGDVPGSGGGRRAERSAMATTATTTAAMVSGRSGSSSSADESSSSSSSGGDGGGGGSGVDGVDGDSSYSLLGSVPTASALPSSSPPLPGGRMDGGLPESFSGNDSDKNGVSSNRSSRRRQSHDDSHTSSSNRRGVTDDDVHGGQRGRRRNDDEDDDDDDENGEDVEDDGDRRTMNGKN